MAGKRVLPLFGGGPAVWTCCMLLFQVLLLAGYGYAHGIAPRGLRRLHIALLLLSLPMLAVIVNRGAWTVASGDPVVAILRMLLATIGLPYLMLSTTGPLVQSWAAQQQPDASPYRLYAASNAASFLALLSYPVAIEPWISLQHQFWAWCIGYIAYAGTAIWCALRAPDAAPTAQQGARAGGELRWMALAACGSTMLLAATNQMCQEVAVIPFLWILPLALYLLTFTICFNSPVYDRRWWGLALAILAPVACALMALGANAPVWPHIAVDTLALVAVCMICHGELPASKPDPSRLTRFYLAIAAGGAVGGVFVAVIAPRIFTDFAEFPIAMGVAALLALDCWRREGTLRSFVDQPLLVRSAIGGLAMSVALSLYVTQMDKSAGELATVRNFYGILRVTERDGRREMTHGRTVHGFQFQDPDKRQWPVSYYGKETGLALAMQHHPRRLEGDGRINAGVIGLGTGSIALYGRPNDTIRFYEINPAVEDLARRYFTYLNDLPAQVIVGDARLVLEREPSRQYDVLVIDAFTSDAIPAHLLTAECAAIYRRHLRDDGLLVFHISNRTLDLAPVVNGIAAKLGWRAGRVVSPANESLGWFPATWIIVSNNQTFWQSQNVAQAIPTKLEWTDDFTSLWRVLKF